MNHRYRSVGSFYIGMAQAFDIGGSFRSNLFSSHPIGSIYFGHDYAPTGLRNDAKAISSDWHIVGGDIKGVMH